MVNATASTMERVGSVAKALNLMMELGKSVSNVRLSSGVNHWIMGLASTSQINPIAQAAVGIASTGLKVSHYAAFISSHDGNNIVSGSTISQTHTQH